MSVQIFRYKPKNTLGITVEVTTDCTCTEKPIVSGRLCGLSQFGLLLCYEDKVQTLLHKWKVVKCDLDECDKAISYELEIKFLISCEIGLGIGIGNLGTGAFGIPTRSAEESVTFHTECICCDAEIENERIAQSMFPIPPIPSEKRSIIPLVVMLLAIVVVAAVSYRLDITRDVTEYISTAMLFGILASGLAVYGRMRRLIRGFKTPSEDKDEHNTAA